MNIIQLLNKDNQIENWSWDPEANVLLNPDGLPPVFTDDFAEFLIKYVDKSKRGTIVIKTGDDCNFQCAYCCQHKPGAAPHNVSEEQIVQLIDALTRYIRLNPQPKHIMFLGGEPFLHWQHIKKIVTGLSAACSNLTFGIITNGSLLKEEYLDFIREHKLQVTISHDGPSNNLRTQDVLAPGSRQRAIIERYIEETNELDLVSFNATFNAFSPSHREMAEFFKPFGCEIPIGEGNFIFPYTKQDIDAEYGSIQDLPMAAGRMLLDFLDPDVGNHYSNALRTVYFFLHSVMKNRPVPPHLVRCGITMENVYAINLLGEVSHCYNFDPDYVMPTGSLNRRGSILDYDNLKPINVLGWQERKQCHNCPVLPFCRGGCPIVDNDTFEAQCKLRYWYYSALLGWALFILSGKLFTGVTGSFHRASPGFPENPIGPIPSIGKVFLADSIS